MNIKENISRMELRRLSETGELNSAEFANAMRQNLRESRTVTLIYLHLWTLGAVMVLAGIICFTAFNWVFLPPFVRLSMAEGALAAVFILMLFVSHGLAGSILSAAFAVLIGCFWAVFGQIYQINTAVYHFPLIWFICLLPFAFIVRSAFVWLLTALLLLSFAGLYMDAEIFMPDIKLFTSTKATVFLMLSAALSTVFYMAKQKLKEEFPLWSNCILLGIFLISLDYFVVLNAVGFLMDYSAGNFASILFSLLLICGFLALFSYFDYSGGRIITYINGVLVVFIYLSFIIAKAFEDLLGTTLMISLTAFAAGKPLHSLYQVILNFRFTHSREQINE